MSDTTLRDLERSLDARALQACIRVTPRAGLRPGEHRRVALVPPTLVPALDARHRVEHQASEARWYRAMACIAWLLLAGTWLGIALALVLR